MLILLTVLFYHDTSFPKTFVLSVPGDQFLFFRFHTPFGLIRITTCLNVNA